MLTLKQKISNLLSIFDPKVVKILTSKKAMITWKQAFTHKSYDKDFNYEYLEFLGDSALKNSFDTYLVYNYPEMRNPKYLSEARKFYMAKYYQANLSDKMDLFPFVKISKKFILTEMKKFDIKEDVFEAFYGALQWNGDMYLNNIGRNLCYDHLATHLSKIT
ncbi:MAG: ribonuclease III domain-containing protein, partial [Cyclobacteriaceae bacterium]